MKQFKQFLGNLITALFEARKAYVRRHLNHLLGS
jgi:hypothetical protein